MSAEAVVNDSARYVFQFDVRLGNNSYESVALMLGDLLVLTVAAFAIILPSLQIRRMNPSTLLKS